MLDQKALRRVFRDWDSLKALGENPLAALPVVLARHQAAGYTPTPVGYGLALREAFQQALESLKPDDGPPNCLEKRWRPYIILTEQYLHGRNPDWVQDQLHVSKGTYYGEQERALEMLAGILQQQEALAARQAGGRAASGGGPGSAANPAAVERAVSGTIATEVAAPDTAAGEAALLAAPAQRRPVEIPWMAPLRPAYPFIGREALLAGLKARLLQDGGQMAGQPALALGGLPGVGKTALAAELANDREIQAHYRDGILWTGLGRQPDLAALLGSWASALGVPGEAIARCSSLTERSALLHAAIGTRRMLLIIDDAWQVDAALAFKVGGPNCAHLLTTRLVDLALDFTGGQATLVHELEVEDGLALLARVAPYAVETSPEEARDLVQLVGGLPLALILVGGYLHKQSFNPQRRRLRQALERLLAAEARLQVAQPQALNELHPGLPAGTPLSLHVVIGLSDAALDDVAHRALLDLSLFPPKPNTFSEEAAMIVADITPDVLDALVDQGLLECLAPDRYTLHQTVADYAACTVYAPYVIYTALTKGASPEAAARLVAYYLDFLSQHAGQPAAIEAEAINLLAAGEIALRLGRPQAAEQIGRTLGGEPGLLERVRQSLHSLPGPARELGWKLYGH